MLINTKLGELGRGWIHQNMYTKICIQNIFSWFYYGWGGLLYCLLDKKAHSVLEPNRSIPILESHQTLLDYDGFCDDDDDDDDIGYSNSNSHNHYFGIFWYNEMEKLKKTSSRTWNGSKQNPKKKRHLKNILPKQ